MIRVVSLMPAVRGKQISLAKTEGFIEYFEPKIKYTALNSSVFFFTVFIVLFLCCLGFSKYQKK